MSKKILVSLGKIGMVLVFIAGTTTPYFNGIGNIFAAGDGVNLEVGDPPVILGFEDKENVLPGDSGEQEVTVSNVGGVSGYLHITFANLVNNEMGCNEPEEDVDITCDNPGPNQGELADNLDLLVYLDENTNDIFEIGTDTLIYQGKARGILQGDLFNYPLAVGASRDFRLEWGIDISVGNEIQSDKTDFDISFELTSSLKDIVGDWHFDENSGSVAYDSALQPANNGTINGATWTGGRYNPALSFDGVNDYVDVPGISDNPSVITQEAWVKTTSPGGAYGWNVIMAKRHADDGSDWATLTIYNGHAVLQVDDKWYATDIYYGPAIVNDGNWHHIVGIKNGCNYSVYVDGNLDSYYTDCHSMGGSPYNLHIGHHGAWGNFFNGEIDEARIYYRVLSASEILAHYQAGM